ncbi:hypothetical protein Godav_021880, partial [Gossypium davidsonii]|nr:hypothetical protein [Gossypium davidsonii]
MRALRVIEENLQEVGFLHVSLMLGGCKLDPTLISALVKRWRPKTHTFHLLCNECTITPEDVALKLNLLINGLVVAGAVYVGDWSGICNALLGKLSEKFFGSRIKMKWLEENFNYLNNSAIMGMVPTTIFTSPSERPLLILIRNKDLEELHKVDLWRRIDEDWAKFHEKYINIWEHRNNFIPIRDLWHSETPTFHLQYGNRTITLEACCIATPLPVHN